jgi:hypothetical protein
MVVGMYVLNVGDQYNLALNIIRVLSQGSAVEVDSPVDNIVVEGSGQSSSSRITYQPVPRLERLNMSDSFMGSYLALITLYALWTFVGRADVGS